MRSLLLLTLFGLLLPLGCSEKKEEEEKKPAQPRKMAKPGDKGTGGPKTPPP
jgi:hypothetical protein